MASRRWLLALVLLLGVEKGHSEEGVVSVQLTGQFGNQLFEIATAYAYALDHNLELTIPDLVHKKKDRISHNAEQLFLHKIPTYEMPAKFLKWKEPTFNYTKIPDATAIELEGFFQSEKYFAHRRKELLEFFAPPDTWIEENVKKYPFLATDAFVVGVQVRDYRLEKMYGQGHPTIGRSYYEKAFALFPSDAIFLVSSNNIAYARQCTEGLREHIIYMDASSNYLQEFYALTLCKSFIISNSSFGWWAAWLSVQPDKVVVAPDPWFAKPYDNDVMNKDLIPEGWIVIKNEKKRKPK